MEHTKVVGTNARTQSSYFGRRTHRVALHSAPTARVRACEVLSVFPFFSFCATPAPSPAARPDRRGDDALAGGRAAAAAAAREFGAGKCAHGPGKTGKIM